MQAAPGAPLSDASQPPAGQGPEAPRAPGRRRISVLAGVAAFVLAADIITKALVVAHLREGEPVRVLGDVLMFNLLRNPGAAFSVGTGDTIVFTAIAVAVVVYIARTARKLYSIGWAITLGLLLGGALGNLTDRIFRAPGLFRGNVVDWIEVTRYWPVFNLADSAIVCGGILTVLLAMLGYHLDGTHGDRKAQPSPPGSDSGSGASPADAAADTER
ncbi:MAG: signal peptidase II [Trebonia sp.]|uniref:signal peptidase II n=1 Tax=Trebonia sp. TaxID=2767075 RepID=UPI003BAEB95D